MEAVEIVRIKDVIIEKVSANDEELKRIFGCSKRQAGERRREMQKLPSQQKHLLDSGQLVTIKGQQDEPTIKNQKLFFGRGQRN